MSPHATVSVLPHSPAFSPHYLARLEALHDAARNLQVAKESLDQYDAMSARRRAVLEQQLADANAAFQVARQAFTP